MADVCFAGPFKVHFTRLLTPGRYSGAKMAILDFWMFKLSVKKQQCCIDIAVIYYIIYVLLLVPF